MAVYEIVPNLSEGRDLTIVDAAERAVHGTGAAVLHRTSDAAHHRSVLTIAGNAGAVLAAALAIAEIAVERIDLRVHRGVHPRIGALDVLPFVPLRGGTMDEAVRLAHEAGRCIWERFRVPVFFYGAAAQRPERTLLADVRSGEFEGLVVRAGDPAWAPDIGETPRHERAGAVAIGARAVLVAFNVELATGNLRIARDIARSVRERDGGFRSLRALGLRLSDDRVQVSLNITSYDATPLHLVVETIRRLAAARGVRVTRSELIGCLPRAAVERAARAYLGVSEPMPVPRSTTSA